MVFPCAGNALGQDSDPGDRFNSRTKKQPTETV